MIDGIDPTSSHARIGLLGCGVVGSAVVRGLATGGAHATVTSVAVRDTSKPRDCPLAGVPVTDDPHEVVLSPDVDVVVEAIGGTDPARELVATALTLGKPVVTANKALLGLHRAELAALAAAAGVPLRFEASVAAAVPIVRTLQVLRQTDEIGEVRGVLNGTSNFVLDRMEATGATLDQALAEARTLGYAEADATRDLDGTDSADKLAILADLAFGDAALTTDIHTVGIGWITPDDLARARADGKRWRLVARAVRGTCLKVEPTLLPADDPLARLPGAHNGVAVRARRSGSLYLQGPGAGGDATAAAILADLRDVVGRPAPRPVAA